MKVLIACEESQEVTKAFRALGHAAYSCDILPCSGGHPEWHIQDDVVKHLMEGWDIMLAFPPCTYLTTTANRVFLSNPERWKKRLEAMIFVWVLWKAPIHRIAIENPKGVISSHIRKPDQYIQPYEHGHPDSKMTGLWLKNLPHIQPTKIVEPEWVYPKSGSGKRMSKTHANNPSTSNPDNAKLRSKTYPGIAKAMAEQWSVL